MKIKIFSSLTILLVVTVISILFEEPWLIVFYNIIIAFFVDEIKNSFKKLKHLKQIRISYSYIFKIEINGNYLLVKDEQGRNNYHPVGGVYKYYPDEIDLGEKFSGEYDGLFNFSNDTENDLRLIINKRRLKDFQKWFSFEKNRETANNITREFKEELIDKKIVNEQIFNNIKYHYVGSYTNKSFNKNLHMNQIRHHDVFSVKLTSSQIAHLKDLLEKNSTDYLFARKSDILNGYMSFAGKKYTIAEYSKLILNCKIDELKKEFDTEKNYSVKV